MPPPDDPLGRAAREGGRRAREGADNLRRDVGGFIDRTLGGGEGDGGGAGGNPLDLAALEEKLGALGSAVTGLQEQVKQMAEGLTDLAGALAKMKLSFGLDTESITPILDALRPPPPPPPVDPQQVLNTLMDAIGVAEEHLNRSNFMMSTVNVNLDMNLAVAGTGVKTTVSFQITPKPIA